MAKAVTTVPIYRLAPPKCILLALISLVLLSPWSCMVAMAATSPWCPSQCQCDSEGVNVQCSGALLTDVPEGLPLTVQYLNLSGNFLTHLSGHHLRNLTWLNTLDLIDNHIVNISSDAFTDAAAGLQVLLLGGNQLQHAPAVEDLLLLHTLDLSRNNLSTWQLSGVLPSLSDLDLSFNALTTWSGSFVQSLPNLTHLDLQHNQLHAFSAFASYGTDNRTLHHPLLVLNLADNDLATMAPDALQSLSRLQFLDLSGNHLQSVLGAWFTHLNSLQYLSLSCNAFAYLPNNAFYYLSSLQTLDLSSLLELTYVSMYTLEGLADLHHLNLSHNPKLEFIHAEAFLALSQVRSIDISHNGLAIIHPQTFHNLTNLYKLDLHGNPWMCDCEAQELHDWLEEAVASGVTKDDIICQKPDALKGMKLQEVPTLNLTCEGASIVNHTHQTWVKIGSAVVVDCIVDGNPRPAITWRTNRGQLMHHKPHYIDFSDLDPEHSRYHDDHSWHETDRYLHKVATTFDERIQVLKNGSLYIDYITRQDGGNFTCIAQNQWGNATVLVEIRLDYTLITPLKIRSIICGFLCAITFFSITVLTSAIRFIVFFFSEEERKKRKSIREVLEAISDYKASKVEKLSAYKSAKLDQFSAKFDKLAAYKSGKMEKLSAFKQDKVGKIRTYKQATVTNVLHHMHNLREYYTSQMCRVKDNCSQQVEKLRENYTSQMDKFKDYRSHQIDKIRDNYHSQVVKIRDYSTLQMTRLREQYKVQQLHILKLLELLEVGNCMTAIEAECMRTESMIFDPDIMFELEPKPVPLPPDIESSGESEYLTAGTGSDQSSVTSIPYILSVQNEKAGVNTPEQNPGENTENKPVPSTSQEHSGAQPKVRKKRRHRMRPKATSDGEVAMGDSCDSLDEPTAKEQASVHRGKSRSYPPKVPLVLSTAAMIHSPYGPAEVDSQDAPQENSPAHAKEDRVILQPAALDDTCYTAYQAQTKETIV